ncbi:hypothetical protein [Autumnicola psychrophila]|uniref:Phosphatidic acid phosphatase type 2/haloperoxidase domain-containing protein n=1 Tax=Autumnicola psychrophila TaxID=3075592 RepID=A0ABU3DNA6_9FLAO|nr:hypothetical protein [Zunongwangia sp. F225]MDT0685195.1 hypothetical protein [Zunongwangia sp. F225]
MKLLLKSASYVFHPLWMPFAGSLLYFLLTPRFFPIELIKVKMLAIAIITMFIPIVFYFLLKNLGKASSLFLSDVQERRWPLFFFILLNLMILFQVLNSYNYPALYFYFVGILFSTITCFIMAIFRVKVSLHLVGLSGLTTFIVALGVHFHLNLIFTIAFLFTALGLTASSRLIYKAHNNLELVLGLFIGLISQLIVVNYWL